MSDEKLRNRCVHWFLMRTEAILVAEKESMAYN